MLASIIYNYGKFCDDFKSTPKLGAYEETVRDRISRCQTATEICEVILNQVYKQRKSTIQEVQEVLGLHRSALADSEHHQIRKKHK